MASKSSVNRADLGLLLMRVGLGIMFIFHGLPKLQGGPEMWTQIGGAMSHFGITFAPAFWGLCAALAEFGGGACLLLGLLTRPAALAMAFTMMVAATMHLAQGDGLQVASHAIENGIVFLSLVFIGAGRWSVDALVAARRKSGAKYDLPA